MSIAPVVCSVRVKAPPARAFELFVSRIADWWPKGRTVGKNPHVAIVIEPRAGGQWFERDDEGTEAHWGKVLAWEPPSRLLLGWQLDSRFRFAPDFMTEVELTFAPLEAGGTLVRLEHRDLERYGADAALVASKVGPGWREHVAQFGEYADAQP
jgi:uncharacterized protein YndB with AHSA1/START domain